MGHCEIRQEAQGQYAIAGALSLDTVPGLRDEGDRVIVEGPEVCNFDLSDAEFQGSAGVAMLIAWLRTARQHSKQVRYVNPPEKLVRIARVSGTDAMLGFNGQESDPV